MKNCFPHGGPNEPGISPRSLWRTRDPVNLGSARPATYPCHTEPLDGSSLLEPVATKVLLANFNPELAPS